MVQKARYLHEVLDVARTNVNEGTYRCRDRRGVVHQAWANVSWKYDWNETDSGDKCDRTLCDETNYMEQVDDEEPLTCLLCFVDLSERGWHVA